MCTQMLTKLPKGISILSRLLPCERRMQFFGKFCTHWVPILLLTSHIWCNYCLLCCQCLNQQPTSSLGCLPPPFGAPVPMHAPRSQTELVDHLVREGAVKSKRIQDVMRAVDRKLFVNPQWMEPHASVYQDTPLAICEDQTISAPHMHGTCLDLLADHLLPGARALDVGSGSGYLTACMASLVGTSGYVVGIDKVRELTARSCHSIKASNLQLKSPSGTTASGDSSPPSSPTALKGCTLMGSGPNWSVYHGNALSDALEGLLPFSAIHVGAAADNLPGELVDALLPGGRMVIPVGPHGHFSGQELMVVEKSESGPVSCRSVMGVRYVPLTHPSEDR